MEQRRSSMALRLIDIASHQAGLKVASIDADGVIVKATQGWSYTNPYCAQWVEDALSLGKAVGVYHYIGGGNAIKEMNFFINSIRNWIGKVVICLDWESYQNSAWRDESYLEECIKYIVGYTGMPPVVYASKDAPFPWSLCKKYNCGTWVAQYASMNKTGWQDAPWNEGSYSCAIRQYTSRGRIAGWSGDLDLNKFYGDRDTWRVYCTGGDDVNTPVGSSIPVLATDVMYHLCTHNKHGYSQPNRQGVGTGGEVAETITLSDGRSVGIAAYDRDCSSAVIECYVVLGVDVGGATSTHNMRSCMLSTGLFEELPASTWANPQPGDILLAEGKHTALAMGDGKLGEFNRSENHTIHGVVGDQDGQESVIRSLYNYPWNCVLRYIGPNASVPDGSGQTVTSAGTYRVISSDGLNVRTQPTTSAKIVATYSYGDTVVLDGWSTTCDCWVWGRYVGASSGKYRYVAIGHNGDNSLLQPVGGKIVVGSKVTVTNPVDVNCTRLAVSGIYDVIQVNGSRVVIARNGVVIAAINSSNLALA